jgi:hypothetical protein
MRVLSDEAMAKGGLTAAKELGKEVWRSSGGSTFYKPSRDDIKRERTITEEALSTFPLNALGSFIKISDRGLSEKIFAEFREIDKRKKIESAETTKWLSSMTTEEKMVIAKVAPKLKRRVMKLLLKEQNTAYSKTLAAATSKEKFMLVLEAMMSDAHTKPTDKQQRRE